MAAVAAHEAVDADRMAVVGHSQGAGFAPHVVDAWSGVGGSLAGNWNGIDVLLQYQADFSLDEANLDLAELRAGTWGGADIFGAPAAFWASWLALDDVRPALAAEHADSLSALNGGYDWNVPPTELEGWDGAGVQTLEFPCITHVLNCVTETNWPRVGPENSGRHVAPEVLDALEDELARLLP